MFKILFSLLLPMVTLSLCAAEIKSENISESESNLIKSGTTTDDLHYTVEINNAGESSRAVVTGDIALSGTHTLNILMRNDNGGIYPTGKIDYNILETIGATSTLTIDTFDVRFVSQPNMTFKIGKLNQPEAQNHEKVLVLQYAATDSFIIDTDQIESDLGV